jgi:hypothetical protein
MYPNTALRGCGDGTLVRSGLPGGSTKGVIELLSTLVSRCAVSDMSIGHPTSAFNGSGIKFDGTGDNGASYGFNTGGDAFIKIRRVGIYNPTQKGIWMIDGREVQIDNVHVQNARQHGVFLDNHSDGKLHRIVANGNAGLQAGIHITGGNTQVSDCKVFYRGNGSSNTAQHGFHINTSRVTMGNCQAQDNGGYGFYIDGSDHSVANCMADSNAAQDTAMGGFWIGATGSYSGLVATDRAQSTNRQNRGIVFSGTPQVYLTGRVDVDSGSNHVVGNPGANSYVRLVRAGTAVHALGSNGVLLTPTVGTAQATVAHGLGYTPASVQITMTSAGNIRKSAASDGTNIYLTADSAGRTAEVWVG